MHMNTDQSVGPQRADPYRLGGIPVLSEAEVRHLVTLEDALKEVEASYAEYGRQRHVLSAPPALTISPEPPHAAFKVKGAHLAGRGITGCRIIADAGRPGREVTTDYCWVSDATSGTPLGLVSETWLHRLRTAATGVVAAKFLGRLDSRVATIIGAGYIAAELPGLLRAAFDLSEIRVAARRLSSAEAFAAAHSDGVPVRAFADVGSAIEGADVVVAISAAEEPVITARHMAPGRTICGLGGGAEIEQAVMEKSDRFVVDDFAYACMIGSVHGWLQRGASQEEIASRVDADIGEVVLGTKPGRTNERDAILAIIQGMASCDLALAHLALRRASLA
jgi:alanine dehydrogenase